MWSHIAEAVELTMDIPFAGPIQPMVKPFFQFHPDDSNFILIYLDYGIDLLAFVGSCDKT